MGKYSLTGLKNQLNSNGIFLIGSVYFLFTTVYSICFYQEKFMIDASSFLFNITNYEWFPPSHQREIMYLQQVIPVLLSKIGVDIKYIMISYIINYYLIFHLIFLIICKVYKDTLSGTLYLLTMIGGCPFSYFLIAAELIPGTAVLILLLSNLNNQEKVRYPLINKIAAVLLLILVIRSHPLVSIAYLSLLLLLIIQKKQIIYNNLKFYIGFLSLSVVLILVKLINIGDYELSYMTRSLLNIKFLIYSALTDFKFLIIGFFTLIILNVRKIRSLIFKIGVVIFSLIIILIAIPYDFSFYHSELMELENKYFDILRFVIYLFHGRILFSFSVLFSLWFFTKKRQYTELSLFLTILLGYSTLLLSVMNLRIIEVNYLNTTLEDTFCSIAHETWGSPLRTIAFAVLLFILFNHYKQYIDLKKLLIIIGLYSIYTFAIIEKARAISTNYLDQTMLIIETCQNEGVDKAIIPLRDLDDNIPVLNNVYQDIIIFSTLYYDSTIQAIYAPLDSIDELLQLPEDKILLEKGAQIDDINNLNSSYYYIEEEKYTLVRIH